MVMPILYADTSAVTRAYFGDEEDHQSLARLLFTSDEPVVTSELTRVEFASAVTAAARCGRVASPAKVLASFDNECRADGAFVLFGLASATVLPLARELVVKHPLRALDAIHLATALTDGVEYARGEDVALVTRDQRQAAAAKACGLRVL
jgi:predicted nucleic acid-binding protein